MVTLFKMTRRSIILVWRVHPPNSISSFMFQIQPVIHSEAQPKCTVMKFTAILLKTLPNNQIVLLAGIKEETWSQSLLEQPHTLTDSDYLFSWLLTVCAVVRNVMCCFSAIHCHSHVQKYQLFANSYFHNWFLVLFVFNGWVEKPSSTQTSKEN